MYSILGETAINGIAPQYPVVVEYAVSGTADSQDHDATDGILTFEAGTETSFDFELYKDNIQGEAGEKIIFTMNNASNAVIGKKPRHKVTVIEANVPPKVKLVIKQSDEKRLLIDRDAGLVVVTGLVNDSNPQDAHTYDWSHTDNVLIALNESDEEQQFVFDPINLEAGIYGIELAVTDDGIPAHTSLGKMTIQVLEAPITLSDEVDSDADGIMDSEEGLGDADGDRIPDYIDALEADNVLQTSPDHQDGFLMETNPGLKLRLGDTAFASGIFTATINKEDIGKGNNSRNTSDTETEHTSQIFDFEASEIPEVGATVDIVLPLDSPIPIKAVYRKFSDANGWADFVVDDNNKVSSAKGEPGFCPSIGDSSYRQGLKSGYYCVMLSIQDGGPNDADGEANGVVVDPGVIAARNQSSSTTESESASVAADEQEQNKPEIVALSADPMLVILIGLFMLIRLYGSRKSVES